VARRHSERDIGEGGLGDSERDIGGRGGLGELTIETKRTCLF